MARPMMSVLLVAMLVACARPDGPGDDDGRSPDISAAPSSDARETLTGRLGADSVEGGCPYLETDDGTRYEVLYPSGWQVDRGNGTLRDPNGIIVARPGATISVRGARAEGMASLCQIGPIFRATEVILNR